MPLLADAFSYLASQTKGSFASTTEFLWWPATAAEAKAATYSVGITAAAGPPKLDENPVLGLISVPVDALVLHVMSADFPTAYLPRPRALCLYGPETFPGSGLPAASCRKYAITNCVEPTSYLAHYEITVTRAD